MGGNDNLYALFETGFRAAGGKAAFLPVSGPPLTFGALDAEVSRVANVLRSAGMGPGDRVTAQVEKSIPNALLYLACLKLGAVFNPLNSGYTAAELDYFLGDAEPAVLVAQRNALPTLEPIAARHKVGTVLTLEADGSGTLTDRATTANPSLETVKRAGDDLAALVYTSGTTGRSKGAMITHGNLSSNAQTLCKLWRITHDDVLLHALPIFHVHGLFVALNTFLLQGASMLWLAKFDHDAVIRLLPRATVMMGVPTFYTRLLATPSFGREACSAMRLFVSGSAPLLAETHREFEQRTGHRIIERYGMTETGMITSNPYEPRGRIPGSVGYALDGVSVRIAGEGGSELPRGEIGGIEVKGPNVFRGYWRNPEKTREEFRADGFFQTGDLGVMEPDGRVSIVGRLKDLIITGGLNVYPKEVEEEINALPGVAEAAVIGVPHADFGEGVVAVIARVPGAAPIAEAAVIGALEGKLARFKLPKRIFVVDDLPRNATGKVQKAELRQRYLKTFSG
jgi:malonyl-CoA/methylmalonyl-CoA synthetase